MKIKLCSEELRNFINNNEIKILEGQKADFPPQPDFINLNINKIRISLKKRENNIMSKTKIKYLKRK